MRKLILISGCLLMISTALFSQSNPKFVYAEIVGEGRLFSTKTNIVLDFGQQMKAFDNRLRDDRGKLREFNSMIDALNFMGKQGWEFVQTYTVVLPNDICEYRYLIRKDFESLGEEEKKIFLKE